LNSAKLVGICLLSAVVALPVTFFLFLAYALSFPNSTSPIPEDVFGLYGLATLALVGLFEVAFPQPHNAE
jgi:hypothetical protein